MRGIEGMLREQVCTPLPVRARISVPAPRQMFVAMVALIVCMTAAMFVDETATHSDRMRDNPVVATMDAQDGPAPAAATFYGRSRSDLECALGAPLGTPESQIGRWRTYRTGGYLIYVQYAANGRSSSVAVVHLSTRTVVEMIPRLS